MYTDCLPNAALRRDIYELALSIFKESVEKHFHPSLCEVLRKAVKELEITSLSSIRDKDFILHFEEISIYKPKDVRDFLWFPLEDTHIRMKILQEAIKLCSRTSVRNKKTCMA